MPNIDSSINLWQKLPTQPSLTHPEVLKSYRIYSLITVKPHGIFKGPNILKKYPTERRCSLCLEKLEPLAVSFPPGADRLEPSRPHGPPAPPPGNHTCLAPETPR